MPLQFYRLVPDTDKFQHLLSIESLETAIDSRSQLADSWNPPDLEISKKTSKNKLGDFIGGGISTCLISALAARRIGYAFDSDCELLPTNVSGAGLYYALHIHRSKGYLDNKHSKIITNTKGKVILVESYVFHAQLAELSSCFKIHETFHTETIVTNEFVELIVKNCLTGLKFENLFEII